MKLHLLNGAPPAWLCEALETFEQKFDYPLGGNLRFRISHGRDYLPFFAAMGKATVLVAEADGIVYGTLARVERKLTFSTTQGHPVDSHYLCDLKVSPCARRGRVLAALMREANRQVEASGFPICHAVVMHGTSRLPTDYTGRLNIPLSQKIAEIMVLRLTAGETVSFSTPIPDASTCPQCRILPGNSSLRSLIEPTQIHSAEGNANGILEDTRRGKRLWLNTGEELLSAHLSNFRYDHPKDGADVLSKAVFQAHLKGLPAVFVAVPATAYSKLSPYLKNLKVSEAQASVYGHGLPTGLDWWVDTSEI